MFVRIDGLFSIAKRDYESHWRAFVRRVSSAGMWPEVREDEAEHLERDFVDGRLRPSTNRW